MITTSLLVCAVLIPGLVLLRRCIYRDGVHIDHVVLFSLGFLFYSVFPFIVARVRPLANDPALSAWYRFVDLSVTGAQVRLYLAFSLLMFLAFILGSLAGSRIWVGRPSNLGRELSLDPFAFDLLWAPVAAGALIYVWRVRDGLFRGYASYATVYQNAGTLSAFSLILLSLSLLRFAYRGRIGGTPLARLAPAAYICVYASVAVALLSLGGRLYVASAILMALVYASAYGRRIKYSALGAVLIGGLSLAGVLGTVRIGGALSPEAVVANLSSESLFTSFSLVRFVGAGRLELINFPRYLMADLVNLVPSAILPLKTAVFLHGPAQDGYVVFAPLGALHMFLSFMVNFGLIGSLLVLFALGGSLSLLHKQRTPPARVSYAMLAGCMAFTLFRDPFSVSLVKNMFEFSLLVPWLFVLVAHMATIVGVGRESTVQHGAPGYWRRQELR